MITLVLRGAVSYLQCGFIIKYALGGHDGEAGAPAVGGGMVGSVLAGV